VAQTNALAMLKGTFHNSNKLTQPPERESIFKLILRVEKNMGWSKNVIFNISTIFTYCLNYFFMFRHTLK
jgi:hypothetical protein